MLGYYSSSDWRTLPKGMKDILEKYFGNGNYGICNVDTEFDSDQITNITIDTVEGNPLYKSTWTHYANIQYAYEKGWEINSQFNGVNKDEMWIYGYYKTFGSAVRNLALKGIKNRKPIDIYR